jgi:glycosyltransferase involved in cell wall biosynthesis
MEWRGGQSQVLMLARGLQELGCNTMVIAKAGSELVKRASGSGVPCQAMPFRFEADISSARMISRIAGNDSQTLLHAHTPHAFGISILARGLASAPPIVFTRRVVFPLKKHLANRWKLSQADRVVAVSKAVAIELEKARVQAEKIRIIHSGADMQKLVYHGPCLNQPLVVMIAGAVEKQKGLEDAMKFIESWNSFPISFHFFGSGDDLEELRRFASSRDNVVVHGFVDDMIPEFRKVFALLSFSPSEGFSNVVLQAMATGLPVLIRETGGIREMIPEDRFGKVFRNLPEALSLFQDLIKDTDGAIQMGKQGSDWVRSNFSTEEMVRKNYELYKEILS